MHVNSTADELPIEAYFVPLTANSDSGDDHQNDFCDYENFSAEKQDRAFRSACQRNTFPKKACKKLGPKKIEDDEPGIAMAMQLRERKPKLEILRTEYDVQEPEKIVPTDCCHHKEPQGKRKFVISFGANSIDVTNNCLQIERQRCQAFWKFIDTQPQLLKLIKEGEFEHISPPHSIAPSVQKDLTMRCQDAEILRAKHKAMKDEERERTMRRKRINEELQKKSGQSTRREKLLKAMPNKKKDPDLYSYADSVKEPFENVMKQMKIFDDFVGNPVSIGTRSGISTPSMDSDPEQLKTDPSSTTFADDEGEED